MKRTAMCVGHIDRGVTVRCAQRAFASRDDQARSATTSRSEGALPRRL